MLGFNDIKKGKLIVLDGEPYQVTEASFMRKQASRPVMRTTLKSLRTRLTKEHTFKQSDKVEEADVERRTAQYLYRDSDSVMFMDSGIFDQYAVPTAALGTALELLIEGQEVDVVLFEGEPVAVDLPIKIDRKVIEAPPGVRGDTSSNVMKEVVIEGGSEGAAVYQ